MHKDAATDYVVSRIWVNSKSKKKINKKLRYFSCRLSFETATNKTSRVLRNNHYEAGI